MTNQILGHHMLYYTTTKKLIVTLYNVCMYYDKIELAAWLLCFAILIFTTFPTTTYCSG